MEDKKRRNTAADPVGGGDVAVATLDRRGFLKGMAAVSVGGAILLESKAPGAQPDDSARARPAATFVGIQVAAHSFFDEGIEYCLDLLRETGDVNALLISSHTYYGAMGRPKHLMADHGVPKPDNVKRKLPRVWVRHHEKHYKDTTLRHRRPNTSSAYSGKEVFSELAEPAHRRGMKLYERMYEPSSGAANHIENFETVLSTDIYGQPGHRPCMNNPEYRAWLVATVRDLFESYDLDGIQYGAERAGPLSDLLFWGQVPGCFCSHCVKKGRAERMDVRKAKEGLTSIHSFIEAVSKGRADHPDGIITGFLRILMKYPEVLAWEYQWSRTANDLHQLLHDTVKSVRPDAQFGRHVDHRQSSYDLLFRAASDYADMTGHSDFIKLILYHDIAGPRIMGYVRRLGKSVLRELTESQTLDLFYAVFGHNPETEAGAAELEAKGLSPNYVYTETRRAVTAVQGRSEVYAGIGMDIPRGGGWGTNKWQSDPDEIYRATRMALDAGGSGVVASREYEEITLNSLRAMGKAVRGFGRG